MKFDFAIGNPPYQQETTKISLTNGQLRRKNIFHHFQIAADNITSVASVLIYPGGRWIHQSGKGLQEFGLNQINDHHLSKIVFYPEAKEVFGNAADLSDGVTIVIKKQAKKSAGFEYTYIKNGNCISNFVDNPGNKLLPLDPRNLSITQKLENFISAYKLQSMHEAIFTQKMFGIESDFVSQHPNIVVPYDEGMKIDYSKKIKLYTNDRAGKGGRAKWFVTDRDVIQQNNKFIDEWQVVVSSANAGGQKRDNQLEIIDNHSAFGRARVALRSFKTLKEAQNFYNYVKTYFIRYAFLLTDEALTTLGLRVPDIINYNDANGLIDFSGNLDGQLFDLAELTEAEIKYIKDTVDNLRKGGEQK